MAGGDSLVSTARPGGDEAGGRRDPEDGAETDHPAGSGGPVSRRWHWRWQRRRPMGSGGSENRDKFSLFSFEQNMGQGKGMYAT